MGSDLGFQPLLEASSGTGVAEHQPTILLIEDDENTLFAMDKLLTRAGYLVLTAGSGHDAIGMLEQPLSPIDVVLLDVHLPDVDGPALRLHARA
jgi:DNA-binding response OmpR family regulator